MDELGFQMHIVRAFDTMFHEDAHVSFTESLDLNPGVPDLHVTVHGMSFWIECKVWRPGRMPSIRPTQVKWIEKELAANGRVVIAVLYKDEFIKVYRGAAARDIVRCKAANQMRMMAELHTTFNMQAMTEALINVAYPGAIDFMPKTAMEVEYERNS